MKDFYFGDSLDKFFNEFFPDYSIDDLEKSIPERLNKCGVDTNDPNYEHWRSIFKRNTLRAKHKGRSDDHYDEYLIESIKELQRKGDNPLFSF